MSTKWMDTSCDSSDAPLKVLLIGHEASRTGAPIILLRLLQWLSDRAHFECEVLLARGGALVSDYQKLARTTVVDEGWLREYGLAGRILRKLKLDSLRKVALRRRILGAIRLRKPDLLYCNTIDCWDALEHLASLRTPMICHVHELDFIFQYGVGLIRSRQILDRSTKMIACSFAVAEYLQVRQGVCANRITTVHEFVPSTMAGIGEKEIAEAEAVFEDRGIPREAAVVAACGSFNWRKGFDLFIQLAIQLRAAMPARDVRFVWIGGLPGTDRTTTPEIEHDLCRAGLEQHLLILGEQPNPAPFLARCDVFVLPSREDPFPLVCLESGNLGKPIVCFRGAGGMPEFVEDDCGVTVPYLDVPAMAAAVARLLKDDVLRREFGENARLKVAARHSLEQGAAAIERVILEVARRPAI